MEVHFQCSLNYLTSPAISSDDKTIQNKLGGDLSGKTLPVLNSVKIYSYLFRNTQVGQKDCFTLKQVFKLEKKPTVDGDVWARILGRELAPEASGGHTKNNQRHCQVNLYLFFYSLMKV